ncbi:MAG: hypothetical protein A7315_09130 [Candidatus Altiarchaeales archaeon WOR_SM1_79]|nr:MAG: hypothetical protein A7315_09130 [Candidatus Altiarchaeales archaeon WOR_SM1_79]
MPGFDGTGPRGLGPLTGGGRGFCSPGVSPAPVYAQTPMVGQAPVYPGVIRGMGFGRGRGMGRRTGRGRGRWF